MDVNAADKQALLRVPGIGPTAASRIIANRRGHAIDTWRDLEAMGVVGKRARAFVTFNGYKPVRAKQLKMELREEGKRDPALTLKPGASHGG